MEDESYEIIKSQIPKHWVIREFNRPDYGIDLVIELFEKIDENVAETLGEFIYVQVKSVKKLEIKRDISNNALKFYGKRAKLLAAFSKFSFQKNEIKHIFGYKDYPIWAYRDEIEKGKTYEPNDIKIQLLYFISQIEGLDVWEHKEWLVLPEAKRDLIKVKEFLEKEEIDLATIKDKVIVLWHQLTNLGTMYEDLCREWFLPKIISLLTSYPTIPEIITEE